MKKKFILLLALICIVCCACVLAACGDPGSGEPTLTELVFVDNDDVEHSSFYDMGSFTYPTSPSLASLSVYAKYSDNSKTALNVFMEGVTISYSYNGQSIAELPSTLSVGTYTLTVNYQGHSVTAQFTIVTSSIYSPFTLALDKMMWKYAEALPNATVTEGTDPVSDYTLYVITKVKYEEIRLDAEFEDKLIANRESLTQVVKPGNYYAFAFVSVPNDRSYNSNFVSVTITKGDVTPSAVDGTLSVEYQYGSSPLVIGKVKLSDISLNNISALPYFTNAMGSDVYGEFVWQTPSKELDSESVNPTGLLKFVPYDADCYNEYVLQGNPVSITIKKGRVRQPYINYSGSRTESVEYDGDDHEIILLFGSSSDLDLFNALVKTSHFSEEMPNGVGADGLLGTRREIGRDRYQFDLKDPVNYYWENESDYWDETDNEYKEVNFYVVGKPSWMSLIRESYSYAIDENRQVKIKINPGTVDSEGNNSSPYQAGTLHAEVLDTYTVEWSQQVYNSAIGATVTVENDGEFDWIVITVTDFKDLNDGYGGTVIIKLTATGADNFADIDTVCVDLHITKYTPRCPIASNKTVQATVGTTVEELYNQYPTLETGIGTWVLYMKQGDDWVKLEYSQALPQAELECKLVFETESEDFIWTNEIYTVVYFTLEGIPATD